MFRRLNYFILFFLWIAVVACSESPGTLVIPEGTETPEEPQAPDLGETDEPDDPGAQLPTARYTVTSRPPFTLPAFYAGMNGRSTEGPSWTDDAFLSLINEMSPASVRYPGGTQGNSWDWRTGGLMGKAGKYPFFIPDFVNGLPSAVGCIYMMNMARPTPATSYTGEESEAVLKGDAVLQAKIRDMHDALAEFARNGKLPLAVELGNEFYFNNEHAAIYAANPELYLNHALIICRSIKEKYPDMYILLCTTKGGTRGRDQWNEAVYRRLQNDAELKSYIRGTVQHHYISDTYGSQEPITDAVAAEVAILEGFSYTESVKADYDNVPAGLKLWITEFGVTKKKEEGGMWAVGFQYVAMSMGWLNLGATIENLQCQHITLEPTVINKTAMKLGPVGIAYGEFMKAASGRTASRLSFTGDEGASSLYGYKFSGIDKEIVLLLNTSSTERAGIGLKSVFNGDTYTIKQYWSEVPYANPVYEGNGIEVTMEGDAEDYTAKPFSLSVLTCRK